MGLSASEVQLVHLCGLVHDIGKIGLPPGLLEKPGALTLDERRQMEDHPEIGERILANVDDYAEIAKIVRHHHERIDGQGYPDGMVGDEIPLLSRIIAVADAYNAMTSDRPYRDAMPSQVARMRLAQAVESQFDTTVTAAFEAILASADETYRTGTRSDFDVRGARIWRSHRSQLRSARSKWPSPGTSDVRASRVRTQAGGTRQPIGGLHLGIGWSALQCCLSSGANSELLEDVSDVHLYRRLAYEQRLGDRLV